VVAAFTAAQQIGRGEDHYFLFEIIVFTFNQGNL
jgi:hypothetical protein